VEAVARELIRGDIVPDIAGLYGLGQHASDQVGELPLRSGDVLTSMQECRQFAVVMLVANERVGPEHSCEPLARVASLVPALRRDVQVAGDMTFVPGEQDRFDV
jgi:hypothetical protein